MEKINIVPNQTPIKLLTMEYPPTRGGAGTYCEELAHATNELGMKIEVFVPSGSHSNSSVKRIQFPFNGSQDWRCSWKIKQFLKSQNLKEFTLHVADPGALRAMLRFGWAIPRPARLMITIHGSEIPKFSRNPLEHIFFRNFLIRANKIHVLSKYNKEELIQFCPQLEDRILLLPGAPAREILPTTNPLQNRNYRKNQLVLLCVGRIHPRKGQWELLRAIDQLPDNLKQRLTCRFIGPQTKRAYVAKVMEKSRSVGCEVEWLGDLSNKGLHLAYEEADLFSLTAMPTTDSVEGFGIVYLEASANGLPIIAHRIGGVEDAVIDGQTGLLSEPSMPEQLVENISKLLENSELRESMGKAGLAWASSHNWQTVARKLYKQSC